MAEFGACKMLGLLYSKSKGLQFKIKTEIWPALPLHPRMLGIYIHLTDYVMPTELA
jgi:hypothetical protein